MDRKSDELILQGLRQGDCKAFDELYMRYAPRVEAFACCMLKSRSEAEDLAHDIFLKIWENRRSIGHIRSLGNYLFRMTKNAVFDRFEHKSVQVRYERQCLAAGDFLSDDVAAKIASEDLLMIDELAVERMPEQRQRVFRLSRYERDCLIRRSPGNWGSLPKRWNTTSARRSPNCGRSSPRSSYSSDIPIFYAAEPEQRWRSLLFFAKNGPERTGDAARFPVLYINVSKKWTS